MAEPQVTWIPARGWTLARALTVLIVGLISSYDAAIFEFGVPVGETALGLNYSILFLTFTLGLALALSFVFLSLDASRLGLSAAGVVLVQLGGTSHTGWDSIEPILLRNTPFGALQLQHRPLGKRGVRSALLTNEQGRALLQHPSAPRWPAPRDVCEKWGLPPYTRD